MAERSLIQTLLSNPGARARMLRNEPDRLKKIYWDYINSKRLEYYTGRESLKKANDHIAPIKKEDAAKIKSMMDEYNMVRAEYNRSFGGHLGVDPLSSMPSIPNANRQVQPRPIPVKPQQRIPVAQQPPQRQVQPKPMPTQKAQPQAKQAVSTPRPARIGAPVSVMPIDDPLSRVNMSPWYLGAKIGSYGLYGSPALPMYNLDRQSIAQNVIAAEKARANNSGQQISSGPIQTQSVQQPTTQTNRAAPSNSTPIANTKARKKKVVRKNISATATPPPPIAQHQAAAGLGLSRETLDAIYRDVYQSGSMMDDGHTDWLNNSNLPASVASGDTSLDVYNPEDYDKYW